jgi:glucose-6-phosphate dehydrogenase assembly protein OpcA
VEKAVSTTINPEKILKELSNLWIETAAPSNETGAVLRACAMTMIVVADESDDPQAISETLSMLMREHPSRAILIRLKKTDGPWLESRVFAQCWKPFGSRQHICCEQIEISASEISLPDVSAVVLPLIVADLPVILWCRCGHATGVNGFRDLEKLAQKVIVDSHTFGDQQTALQKLVATRVSGVRLADLAWGRLTRSRELVAQAVNSEDVLAALRKVDTVKVRARGAKPGVSARYFAAWLANELAVLGANPKIAWDRAGDETPTSISAIFLSSPEGFSMSIEVKEWYSTGVLCDLAVNGRTHSAVLLRPSEYELLLQELSIPGRDPTFEAALKRAATET